MIERVPLDADGHVDLHQALRALAARGITRVFSEGGPLVASRLIALGLADEVALITAEKPLGRPGVAALDAQARAALIDGSRYHARRDAGLRAGHDAALAAGGCVVPSNSRVSARPHFLTKLT